MTAHNNVKALIDAQVRQRDHNAEKMRMTQIIHPAQLRFDCDYIVRCHGHPAHRRRVYGFCDDAQNDGAILNCQVNK